MTLPVSFSRLSSLNARFPRAARLFQRGDASFQLPNSGQQLSKDATGRFWRAPPGAPKMAALSDVAAVTSWKCRTAASRSKPFAGSFSFRRSRAGVAERICGRLLVGPGGGAGGGTASGPEAGSAASSEAASLATRRGCLYAATRRAALAKLSAACSAKTTTTGRGRGCRSGCPLWELAQTNGND